MNDSTSIDEVESGDILIWHCKKDKKYYKVTLVRVIDDYFFEVEFPRGTREWVRKVNCSFFSRAWGI